MPPSPTLTRAALNRALLARQLLLARERRSAAAAIERLVGMQAQEPPAPHVGLWARLHDFDTAELDRLHTERAVVRGWLMRRTLHVATAADYLALRPIFADVGRRAFLGQFRHEIAGVDLDDLDARARAALEEEPLGFAELGRRLSARWPDHDPQVLGLAAGAILPVLQVPPRGLWGDRTRPRLATAEHLLGVPPAAAPVPEDAVLRYLAAFGPATAADLRAWSGLTGAAALLDALRPQLRTFRDERGRELFDVPEGPLPAPGVPAPVRYLPEYDNAILAYADRSRILADGAPPRVVDHATVTSCGFVVGTWRIDDGLLTVRLFAAADEAAVEAEGERLLAFAGGAASRGVRIVSAPGR